MARVTVEDCLDNVDNRFQLVLVATKRARQLEGGKDAQIEWENDKPTVVALREIAEGLVGREVLNEVIEPRVSFDEDAELQAVLREEIANATGAGRDASAGSDAEASSDAKASTVSADGDIEAGSDASAGSDAEASSDAKASTASADSDIEAGSDVSAESPASEAADDAEEM